MKSLMLLVISKNINFNKITTCNRDFKTKNLNVQIQIKINVLIKVKIALKMLKIVIEIETKNNNKWKNSPINLNKKKQLYKNNPIKCLMRHIMFQFYHTKLIKVSQKMNKIIIISKNVRKYLNPNQILNLINQNH